MTTVNAAGSVGLAILEYQKQAVKDRALLGDRVHQLGMDEIRGAATQRMRAEEEAAQAQRLGSAQALAGAATELAATGADLVAELQADPRADKLTAAKAAERSKELELARKAPGEAEEDETPSEVIGQIGRQLQEALSYGAKAARKEADQASRDVEAKEGAAGAHEDSAKTLREGLEKDLQLLQEMMKLGAVLRAPA